jgi:hypothetical protein
MSRGFRGRYRVGPTPRQRPGRSHRQPRKIMTISTTTSVPSHNACPARGSGAADRPLLSGAPLEFAEAVVKVLREHESRIARLEALAIQASHEVINPCPRPLE